MVKDFSRCLLFLTLAVIFLYPPNPTVLQAQNDNCGFPRYLIDQPVEAVPGAVYWKDENFGTALTTPLPPNTLFFIWNIFCEGNVMWYGLSQYGSEQEGFGNVKVEAIRGTAICDSPRPTNYPSKYPPKVRLLQTSYENNGPVTTNILAIHYQPDQNKLLIASQNEETFGYYILHPAVWDYHEFDLTTGEITPAEYPDGDIITPKLTDRLGITDDVFGVNSSIESLRLSPTRDKLLYRVNNSLWVANADGSSPIALHGSMGFTVAWGKDRVYMSQSVPEGGWDYTQELCLDGSCFTDFWTPFDHYDVAFVSVSPNGRLIAIPDRGLSVYDRITHSLIEFHLENVDFKFPPLWSEDELSVLYLRVVSADSSQSYANYELVRQPLTPSGGTAEVVVSEPALGYDGPDEFLMADFPYFVGFPRLNDILIDCDSPYLKS